VDVQARQAHGPAARHRQGAHARAGGEPPRALAQVLTKYNESAKVDPTPRLRVTRPRGPRRSSGAGRGRRRHLGGGVRARGATCSVVYPAPPRSWKRSHVTRASRCLSDPGRPRAARDDEGRHHLGPGRRTQLAKDNQQALEAGMQYPVHIKVIVTRETARRRSGEVAPRETTDGRRRLREPGRQAIAKLLPRSGKSTRSTSAWSTSRTPPAAGSRADRQAGARGGADVMTSANPHLGQARDRGVHHPENLLLRPATSVAPGARPRHDQPGPAQDRGVVP